MQPVGDFGYTDWAEDEPARIGRVTELREEAFPGSFFYELWKTWAKQPVRLVRVIAHMLEPYVPSAGIRVHLDSILAWAVADAYSDKIEVDRPRVIPIPAAALWTDGQRVLWGVGDLAPAPGRWIRDKRYRHRRYKEAEAEWSQRKNANRSVGRWKDNRVPVEAVLTPRVCTYALAIPEALREVLKGVTHIGSNTSRGYGRVDRWEVEEVKPEADDVDFLANTYIFPLRNLPAEMGAHPSGHEYQPVVAWAPPYWYLPWHSPGYVPRSRAHACPG